MRDLDLDADSVRAMIDDGRLSAFNIAVKTAGHAELRILTRSIENHRVSASKKPLPLEWPEIFRLIVPHQKLYLRGVEIQRSLNCDQGLIASLIRAGCFVLAKKARTGPGGSPIVTRSSFEKFLIGRLQ